MIQSDILSVAKELGFSSNIDDSRVDIYLLYCEIQKWLREEKGVTVLAPPYTVLDENYGNPFDAFIWMIHKVKSSTKENIHYDTYEQALASGLVAVLDPMYTEFLIQK